MKNRAFTLIELLVVVLIIGILAAIALPQYQKAVWKSRYAQAKAMGSSLAEAMEVYYMANGSYTGDIDNLDVNMPVTYTSCDTEEKRKTSNCEWHTAWGLCGLETRGRVFCKVNRDGKKYLGYSKFLSHSADYAGKTYCHALYAFKGSVPDASDLNYQICQAETGKKDPVESWSIDPAFLY